MEQLNSQPGKNQNEWVQAAMVRGDHKSLSALGQLGAKRRAEIKEAEEALRNERVLREIEEIRHQANEDVVPVDPEDEQN